MKSAAATPNNAMNAGNSIDWDIAAENGSRRKSGICKAVPVPPGGPNASPPGIGGISEVILDVMKEPLPALPNPAPPGLFALYPPEPAPASRGGRLRVAVAANGAQMN